MKPAYSNSFARGQKLVRYLLAAALILGLLGFLAYNADPGRQLICMLLSLALLISALVCTARLCRCPRCGKTIVGGVLVLETCPRCKCNLYTGDKVKKSKKK